ncbi:MAG: GntR family transcriptional regulator [Candidatus Hodarchaeota archaeon]
MKLSSGEIIYHKLIDHILHGKIVPGEKIDESKLSQEFQVSRTPLREAIRRLQSEGLVTVEPQRGATVKRPSIEEVSEIYAIRPKLEGLAVELAVNNFNEAEQRKLLEFKRKFRSSLQGMRNLKWLEDNIDFHFYFAKLSGNDTLFQVIKNLNMRVHKYRYISLMHPECIEQYTFQHEQIIDSVINSNPKKAGKVMEMHLNSVRRNLMSYLKEFPFLTLGV